MIDVYSMGNVFYFLLMEEEPFESSQKNHDNEDIKRMIENGEKPKLSKQISESNNESVQALIKAMNMCHVFDYKGRPAATAVRDFLRSRMLSIMLKIEKM